MEVFAGLGATWIHKPISNAEGLLQKQECVTLLAAHTKEIHNEAVKRGLESRKLDLSYGETNNILEPWGFVLLANRLCSKKPSKATHVQFELLPCPGGAEANPAVSPSTKANRICIFRTCVSLDCIKDPGRWLVLKPACVD